MVTMGQAPRVASFQDFPRPHPEGLFSARARGLLLAEFILLDSHEQEFGRLRLRGGPAAEFRSGNYAATFAASGRRYRMVANGEEVLVAAPKGRSIDELEISCGGQSYEAQTSLFRNLAVASHPGGERAARLSGGLTGRRYEALFASEDGCALPVAVFLLWHVAANRRRAHLMGGLMGR